MPKTFDALDRLAVSLYVKYLDITVGLMLADPWEIYDLLCVVDRDAGTVFGLLLDRGLEIKDGAEGYYYDEHAYALVAYHIASAVQAGRPLDRDLLAEAAAPKVGA